MAETVHLFLKAKGVDIKGESTQISLGRQDSIECTYYEQGVTFARTVGPGPGATGRHQYTLVFRKRIDKASPLIIKALVNNEPIEGVFRFFRPNPSGDATTEQFYTVMIKGGSVTAVRQIVPDTISPVTSKDSPLEEVSIVFNSIQWLYTNGAISCEDSIER